MGKQATKNAFGKRKRKKVFCRSKSDSQTDMLKVCAALLYCMLLRAEKECRLKTLARLYIVSLLLLLFIIIDIKVYFFFVTGR